MLKMAMTSRHRRVRLGRRVVPCTFMAVTTRVTYKKQNCGRGFQAFFKSEIF